MTTIPSYPPPARTLQDNDMLLGFAGATSSIRLSILADYVAGKVDAVTADALTAALGGLTPAQFGALRVTSAYAFPAGSVKKEALFAALDAAGHLSDLLGNQPAVYNEDGTLNDAGYQLQYSFTMVPTDAGAQVIRDRYYAEDDAGFAALFAAAGSGSTTPSTITSAAVVDDIGPSPDAVMSQAAVTGALAAKSDRFPSAPHLPLATGITRLTDGWYRHFFNATENHLRPTDGGGGAANGLPDSATTPSSWQSEIGLRAMYYEWKVAKVRGDTTRMATVAGYIAGQWTYYQSKFAPADIKAGQGVIVNASDDCALHADALTIIHEVTGDPNALVYAVEFIPWFLNQYHDAHQTQIDYAVTTPGGIAFKSDPHGVLYFPASQTPSGDGYQSSLYELDAACAAHYISQQPTTSALTAPMKAAMLAYARNTWAWVFHDARASSGATMPAPTIPPAPAIYFTSTYLDPTNANVYKGGRFVGSIDAPVRGQSAYSMGLTLRMASLSLRLGRLAGADPKYFAEAAAIAQSFTLPNGFGRTGPGGVPLIGNPRDPWVDGTHVPCFLLDDYASGASSTGAAGERLALAVYNSGQAIVSAVVDGYSTPDWSGDEYCPATGYMRWTDDGGAGGQGGDSNQDYGGSAGGGQATPRQIMTSAATACVAYGALLVEPYVQKLGSGVTGAEGIEAMPARLAALELAVSHMMPRSGGYFSDKFGIDTQFYMNRNANPWLNMANGALVAFDRGGSSQWSFYTLGTIRFTINPLGIVSQGAITSNGSIKAAPDNTYSCGEAAFRFSVVYAGTGSINTSDETEKTIRGSLTSGELAAARDIAKSTIVFQFNDVVAEKGADGARLHVGYGAQTVFGIMTAHGLDPHRYAFCCFDEWPEDPGEPATDAGPEGSGVFATLGRPARPAGQRYGLRMDELHAFIGAAQEQRLIALETPHA